MPQFAGGRHVALSASPYLGGLAAERIESTYFAVVALRLHAATTQSLRDHLVIGYVVEGRGTPPNMRSCNCGGCVADRLVSYPAFMAATPEGPSKPCSS